MTTFNRRRLLQLAGLAAGAGLPASAFAGLRSDGIEAAVDSSDRTVRLSGDGVGLTPDVECDMDPKLLEKTLSITDVEKRLAQDTQLRTAVGILRTRL